MLAKRIIDLVAGAVGQLFERIELFDVSRVLLEVPLFKVVGAWKACVNKLRQLDRHYWSRTRRHSLAGLGQLAPHIRGRVEIAQLSACLRLNQRALVAGDRPMHSAVRQSAFADGRRFAWLAPIRGRLVHQPVRDRERFLRDAKHRSLAATVLQANAGAACTRARGNGRARRSICPACSAQPGSERGDADGQWHSRQIGPDLDRRHRPSTEVRTPLRGSLAKPVIDAHGAVRVQGGQFAAIVRMLAAARIGGGLAQRAQTANVGSSVLERVGQEWLKRASASVIAQQSALTSRFAVRSDCRRTGTQVAVTRLRRQRFAKPVADEPS